MSGDNQESISKEAHGVEVIETVYRQEIDTKDADVTLKFMLEHDKDVPEATPEQDKKLYRKILFHVLGLTFLINLLMYMDKAALSYSSILGFWEATGLDQDKYNNVNTIFYVGFIVGQVPGTYGISKLPLRWMMFGICFIWSLIIFMHCAAYNYAGVIVLRFFLGLTESVAIPILTTTNGMFFTRDERAATQPIFYASCMGSPIPIGFIAYGVIYSKSSIGDYRVLNIIIGGLTFITAIIVFFLYPNNPTDANFLSIEEKVWVIRRVQRTSNSSIEQKNFKRAHAIETFKDPITWLICGFFLLQQLANNLPYQQTLLYDQMGGINNLDSTLVTVASAGYALVWSITASLFMHFFPNTTCFTVIWSIIPAWVGSVVAVSLDWNNTIGILAAICMASQSFGVAWICAFGYAATTAGSSYSKRLTRNALVMAAYSIANIISPQIWQSKDAPRYVPAWVVQIVLSFSIAPGLMGIVWFILSRRNKRRLAAMELTKVGRLGVVHDGDDVVHEVNIANLDLTDLEDETFIYPL